jgi:DNA-binding NarL/FixJ family response regulator
MLKAGALGYLNKNADTDEILEAITQVMTGKTFFSQSVKDLLNNKSPDDSLSGKPSLSSREKQILALIVDGLTNQEIADKLFISLQTAISHRKNILIKFNAKNTAELVKLTLQSNYLE